MDDRLKHHKVLRRRQTDTRADYVGGTLFGV
jgi:hypothetical protein